MRPSHANPIGGAIAIGISPRCCSSLRGGQFSVFKTSFGTGARRSGGPKTILEHVTDQAVGGIGQQLVWGHAKGFRYDYELNVGDFPVSALYFGHSGTIDGHAGQLENMGKSGLSTPRRQPRTEVLYPPP